MLIKELMEYSLTQRRIFLSLIRDKSASRKNLAQEFGLTQAALTLSVKPLLAERSLLSRGKRGNGKAGRNEELLVLNPTFGYFLGIDGRKHFLYTTLLDFAGKEVDSRRFESVEALESYLITLSHVNILSCGVTLRKQIADTSLGEQREKLFSVLKERNYPFTVYSNNVLCLARLYGVLHNEERNFLLVKYGPGLGSAIIVNGAPITREGGVNSEIGSAHLADGNKLEDVLSFSALLGEDLEEKDGAERLANDEFKLSLIIRYLALACVDANALLGLDKIVFSGILLSNENIRKAIVKKMQEIDPEFPEDKVVAFEDYEDINEKKAALLGAVMRLGKVA